MKSNKQTAFSGTKHSPRYIAVSAVVTAIAIVLSCVTSFAHSGSLNTNAILTGGSVLRASASEEQPIVENDWNINNVEVEIVASFEVAVSVDGVIRTVVMENGTVADALDMAGIVVFEEDIVSLPLDTVLTDNTSVTVDRVTFKERTETETVPFGKTSYETDDYNKGDSVVVTTGKNGEKTLVYKDRYINGEFADSSLEDEFISVEPVDQVTAIGTYVKPVVQAPASGSAGSTPDFSYSAVYYGKGTAYTNEGGICGEYTASGMKAQVGVVAVNPNVIPYGTRLYITTPDGSYTYGYCVAGDTGGFIYSHPDTIVDLFYNTVAECYAFGRRDVIVYVLD